MPGPVAKRSSWFVTLPVAGLAIGYLYFVFFPTAAAIRETRGEIRLKQDYISQTEKLHQTVTQLEQNLNEVQQYTQQWRRQAPIPGQLSDLFGKISSCARECGALITRFEPQTEIALEHLHRVPVQMDLACSYSTLCHLLAELEQLPETIWIDEVRIEKVKENGKDMKCALKLDVFAGDFKKSD
jgi:Tfp pilus assembly protein PilO